MVPKIQVTNQSLPRVGSSIATFSKLGILEDYKPISLALVVYGSQSLDEFPPYKFFEACERSVANLARAKTNISNEHKVPIGEIVDLSHLIKDDEIYLPVFSPVFERAYEDLKKENPREALNLLLRSHESSVYFMLNEKHLEGELSEIDSRILNAFVFEKIKLDTADLVLGGDKEKLILANHSLEKLLDVLGIEFPRSRYEMVSIFEKCNRGGLFVDLNRGAVDNLLTV